MILVSHQKPNRKKKLSHPCSAAADHSTEVVMMVISHCCFILVEVSLAEYCSRGPAGAGPSNEFKKSAV